MPEINDDLLSDVATINDRRHPVVSRELAAMEPARIPPASTQSQEPEGGGYLQRQQATLWAWADPERAARRHDRPWDLLRAVCDHYGATLSPTFIATLDPRELEDEAWLDQAALLFGHETRARPAAAPETVQSGELLDASARTAAPVGEPSLSELRALFLTALNVERDAYALRAALLLPPDVASATTAIYFDGLALHHARGLSLEQIAVSSALPLPASMAALSGAERLEQLRARFADLGEDTQYPVGSVAHSLASTVLRILSYQSQAAPVGVQSEQQWARAFQDLEVAWAETKNYPLHPRLLFALHLATSNDVRLLVDDWAEQLWQQLQTQLRASDQSEALQLASERLMRLRDSASLSGAALPLLFEEIIDGRLVPPLSGLFSWLLIDELDVFVEQENSEALLRVLQYTLGPALQCEILSGCDWAGKLQALMRYAGERLQAAFEAPPRFSRRAEAERMLGELGLSVAALARRRPYILTTHDPNIAQEGFGSPVDEFLARADWSAFPGRSMRVVGRVIEPGALLQALEEQFNRALPTHPWVRAYAKEQLRALGRVPWPVALEAEVARIVADYLTETENHRGWVRGLTTWINVVPILGPIYNIEEGIRGRDPLQAVLGTLFLALDALDLLSGGDGAAKSAEVEVALEPGEAVEMVATRSSASDDSERAPLLTPRVQDRQSMAALRRLAHEFGADAPIFDRLSPQRAADPFAVRRGDAAPAATRASWRRRSAPAATTVRGTPVAERLTCVEVRRLMDAASDGAFKDFDRMFARHFTIERHGEQPSRIDPAQLFKSFYQDSPTFRRLMNYYVAKAPAGEVWRLHLGEVQSPGHAMRAQPYTDLTRKSMYLQADQALSQLRYMTAEGHASLSLEQPYLHEMLHALTGAHDPDFELALLNRGPVVYLTDRILAESGRLVAPQVMYRREDLNVVLAPHQTVAGNRARAAEAALAEDRYLDGYLARYLAGSVPELWVQAGQAVDQAVIRLRTSFSVRGAQRHAAEAPRFTLSGRDPGLGAGGSLTLLLQRLQEQSSTFLTLLAGAKGPLQWRMEWSSARDTVLELERQAILLGARDGWYYLYEQGVAPLEATRRVADALVMALSGLSAPQGTDARAQRGALIILAEKMLQEAGYHYPRRLSAALTDALDGDHLQSWLTPARRRADFEDQALSQTLAHADRLASNRVQ